MRTHASKPTPIALFLTLALAVPMLSATARADELVMPYSCQMVGGHPLLVSSSPQTYRISGPHEQRKITLCSPADPNRCRAWNVHSFTMNCGGAEVPWPAVIAGSPPARDGRARLENGRLQLSMPPAWNLPASDPCARQMDTPAQQRDTELERYCSDRRDLTQQSSVEMPAGFAPTLGLDVKFVAGGSPVAAAPSYNAAAPSYNSPAPSKARPEPGLTAQTPSGGLTWKASPVAPPQPGAKEPGALQAGVPFDPDQPAPAPKKKQPPETKAAARIDPPLKPALPPVEQAAPARAAPPNERAAPLPAPTTDARPEPVTQRQSAIEHPLTQAITPPAPAPAIKPVEPPAKVAAFPQPEPAPLPAPVIAAPSPAAPPVLPPQTATSESAKTTQVAESMTKQEPYSSRPQKLTPPNSGTSLTTILIAAGLALSALGTFFWMRRERDPDELPAGPRVYAGPGFDSGFDNDTRTIPSLSAPMSPDGLHRAAEAHPLGPAFGPYGQHVEPAFDDPLGPVLPEWPNLPESSGNDHPRLEPAFSEPDLAHDWTAPNHAHSHTLEIPAHDELRLADAELASPAAIDTGHLVATPPEPSPPSNWAGSADWPTQMPQTHDDALHILGMGVTSKASLTAMKKIVDGLRLSWHPDQATDDADRAIRELRIRQINTAWDIIASGYPSHDGDPII